MPKRSSNARGAPARGRNRRRGVDLTPYVATVLLSVVLGIGAWGFMQWRRPPADSGGGISTPVVRRPDGSVRAAAHQPAKPPTTGNAPSSVEHEPVPGIDTEDPDKEPPPLGPDGVLVPAPRTPISFSGEISRANTGRQEVALTFDAGSDWRPVKRILAGLEAARAQSTFFLTGEWIVTNPKSTAKIVQQGHEVGNHSFRHRDFTTLDAAAIREELRKTDAAFLKVAGRQLDPLFRPPLGARNPEVLSLVGEEGYLSIYWTLDSHDSVQKDITAAEIRDRVLSGVTPGSILLLHCGSEATAEALPEILLGLRAKGLQPVTVSRLLQE